MAFGARWIFQKQWAARFGRPRLPPHKRAAVGNNSGIGLKHRSDNDYTAGPDDDNGGPPSTPLYILGYLDLCVWGWALFADAAVLLIILYELDVWRVCPGRALYL